jgi:tRNA pseudouridine55 synthase
MDGVLVVDKPAGRTSHDVVAIIRRAVRDGRRAQRLEGKVKVGHAGTLDPDATGVLVLTLGRATRLTPFLQASTKTYDARMRLGVETSTLDASGEIRRRRDASGVDEEAVCEALKGFLGAIEQTPPMVSAVKVGGERLYAKARRGEEIEREPRRVIIHDLVLEAYEPGPHPEVAFLVRCSAGTYVRSLAADVGEVLGVGAHLVALRRIASGRFSLEDALPMDKATRLAEEGRLADALVTPAEAMADFPSIKLDAASRTALGHGRPLPPTGLAGPVSAVADDGTLVAVVEDRENAARPLVVLAPSQGAQDAAPSQGAEDAAPSQGAEDAAPSQGAQDG